MSEQEENEQILDSPNIISKSLPGLAWLLAGGLLVVVVVLVWRVFSSVPSVVVVPTPIPLDFGEAVTEFRPPPFDRKVNVQAIDRQASPNTIVPERARVAVLEYEVVFGDSLFGIAGEFEITPETLLWANKPVLGDNPDTLEPGMLLQIPPIDGVLYQWQQGDVFEDVAKALFSTKEKIIDWVGNQIDLANPTIAPGAWVMVPDGEREFQQWVIPVPGGPGQGVDMSLYGAGACPGTYTGAGGTGTFAWPTPIHELVGNDYWSGHLAVDLATNTGVGVFAADSGVVVFSGFATGGYGNMVMIDHGNGYVTLYAHMSSATAYCGQSAGKGTLVGYGGSTGNSTGPHLHFEVRYLGGFVSPWSVLP